MQSEEERLKARKAAREMRNAVLIITGAFVFVLIAVALIMIFGRGRLF